MFYHVCGTVHVKEPLLLTRKSTHVVAAANFHSGYLGLSFAICLIPYNHKYYVLSALLNKIFPSFLVYFNVNKNAQRKRDHYRCVFSFRPIS